MCVGSRAWGPRSDGVKEVRLLVTPVRHWGHDELRLLDHVLEVLVECAETGTARDAELLRRNIGEWLRMPTGDPMVAALVVHPFMLSRFAWALSDRLGHNLRKERDQRLPDLRSLDESTTVFVRIRRFQAQHGRYFGYPFLADDAYYSFWDDSPVLLTMVPREWLDEQRRETDLGWIARPEVRMLASLSFSVSSGVCRFQLSDDVYDVPEEVVLAGESGFSEPVLRRALAVARILARAKSSTIHGYESTFVEFVPYEFRTQGIAREKTRRFYESFSIQDDVMLRTAFFLLKAQMLWTYPGQMFAEDACANLFFGLEGCLRLIHRRAAGTPNFELESTLQHIEDTFTARPGYGWMLKDAYEKRIQIVHPEPRTKTPWLPPLSADDFYENYDMAIDLIYYAVTGELLPREDY